MRKRNLQLRFAMLLVSTSILAAACGGKTEERSAAESPAPPPSPAAAPAQHAVATIEGRSGTQVTGAADFRSEGGRVTLALTIRNAAPGTHAVHLHETGDCSDPEGKSAGAHWNPTGAPHGKWGESCHLGDIGNFEVGENGEGTYSLTTDLWTIGGDAGSNIVGRAVIVHAQADDFQTQPTGNAGGRIGCGVIRAAD